MQETDRQAVKQRKLPGKLKQILQKQVFHFLYFPGFNQLVRRKNS